MWKPLILSQIVVFFNYKEHEYIKLIVAIVQNIYERDIGKQVTVTQFM